MNVNLCIIHHNVSLVHVYCMYVHACIYMYAISMYTMRELTLQHAEDGPSVAVEAMEA